MFRHDLRTRSSWAILPFLVSLAIVFAATGCDQGEPGKSAPPVQTPGDTPKDAIFAIFKEARDRAKKEDKLVMVELYDEACQYCETMEGETLSDDSVVEALKDFVQVQITPKH
ncbi:MAG: thioredoxin family protein, partial [Planctomycetota bacterium]